MEKKTLFNDGKWIWCTKDWGEDEYSEFTDSFEWNGGNVTVNISARGDYTLFVNGKYAASNQYADFEYYKVYDEIDITSFLTKGTNRIAIVGWYFGRSGMRWFTPRPGIIFEIKNGGNVVCASSENTKCRKSKAYLSGRVRKISPQIGYTFLYDACREDEWITTDTDGFGKSILIDGNNELIKRPIKKHKLCDTVKGKIEKTAEGYMIDFGREVVGLCSFSFYSEDAQDMNIAFGELLENGHVKRKITQWHDFSFDYTAKKGKNNYTNYMQRFACRYMEITCEKPLEFEYFGIIPVEYEVKEKSNRPEGELDKKIYEMCLNTLKLCMLEHYVDCPWREQCLYAFDSRNQILFGYSAYEDGNYEYARANLRLIGMDNRDDGLLSICCPSNEDLTIPSFSLYFLLSVKEYIEHSKDLTLAEDVFEKLESILTVFYKNMHDDIVYKFKGDNHWNFYDWTMYCDGFGESKNYENDFILNALMVIALKSFDYICAKIGKNNKFEGVADRIAEASKKRFLNKGTGLFFTSDIKEKPTELANSLAILSGIVAGDEAKTICEKMIKEDFVQCSLSMKIFKYDALLNTDKEKYSDMILNEIRSTYKIMLDAGYNTAWEVIEGSTAFDNAGSMCHGWSAVPIYIYDKLNILRSE